MGVHVIREVKRKARKEKPCKGCLYPIKVGDEYMDQRCTCSIHEIIYSWPICLICADILANPNDDEWGEIDDEWDGYGEGTLREWVEKRHPELLTGAHA